jgi:hypothetical protein
MRFGGPKAPICAPGTDPAQTGRPKPGGPSDFAQRIWGTAYSSGPAGLWAMAMVAMLTTVAAFFLLAGFASNDAGARGGGVVVDGPTSRMTIGPVHLTRSAQFVTVKVDATNFTNRWVDLDYLLVNRATQAAIPASATIEYYAGRDPMATGPKAALKPARVSAAFRRATMT